MLVNHQLTQIAEPMDYFHEPYELDVLLSQANRKRSMQRLSPPILASEKIASITARFTKSYAMGSTTGDAHKLQIEKRLVVLDGPGNVRLVS